MNKPKMLSELKSFSGKITYNKELLNGKNVEFFLVEVDQIPSYLYQSDFGVSVENFLGDFVKDLQNFIKVRDEFMSKKYNEYLKNQQNTLSIRLLEKKNSGVINFIFDYA